MKNPEVNINKTETPPALPDEREFEIDVIYHKFSSEIEGEKETVITDNPDLREGIDDAYKESEEEADIAQMEAKDKIEAVNLHELAGDKFNQQKEELLAKMAEADKDEILVIKEEYKRMIEEKSLELSKDQAKPEILKFVLSNLDDFNQAESEKNSFFVKTVNKISELTNKWLYVYIPKQIKESKYGKYAKYAGAATIGTALVATLAPSSAALASLGIGGYFGFSLAKKIMGATIGGAAGAGAAKLYL